jgi:hypothetical protein
MRIRTKVPSLISNFSSCQVDTSSIALKLARTDGTLNVAPLHFVNQVITGTDAQRHDGECWILARVGDETGCVHDKQIVNIVGLLELIQH